MNPLLAHGAYLKRCLRGVSAEDAFKFYATTGYLSSSFILPEFFSGTGFDSISLTPINWAKVEKIRKTTPINLYTPKGTRSWRRFSLVHPYAYHHIIKEITQEDAWGQIVSRLTAPSDIAVYSLPRLDGRIKQQGKGIKSWIRFAESDLLKASFDYKYLAVTDIKNFYPSIYTHSIAWALDGKEQARADSRSRTNALLGNRLDRLFQNARDGQTNGIPVGSSISDLVGEIVLADVDRMLTAKLREKNIDYRAGRYRDDYKFLCSSAADCEDILKYLNRILHDYYDLSLNDDKTHVYNDVVAGAVRPWDLEIKNSPSILRLEMLSAREYIKPAALKYALLASYQIQEKHPNSRAGITCLIKIIKALDVSRGLKSTLGDVEYCISLLRRLMLLREEITPHAMVLIDKLISYFPTKTREKIIRHMYTSFSLNVDAEYQEVWLYRLALHHAPRSLEELFASSESVLMQMMIGDAGDDAAYYATSGAPILTTDITELRKFILINRSQFTAAKDTPIDPSVIDAFSYGG